MTAEVSNLFAIEAEQLLMADFTDEALALCTKGLELYPDYPLAFTVMSSIYEKQGNIQNALTILETASNKFPLVRAISNRKSELLNRYPDVEEFEVKSDLIETVTDEILGINNTDVIDDVVISVPVKEVSPTIQELSFLKLVRSIEQEGLNYNDLKSSNLKLIPGIEFTPLQVQIKRSKANSHIQPILNMPPFSFEPEIETELDIKPSEPKKHHKSKSEEHKHKPEPELHIVTETIAKILEQQGAYDAAIKAYNTLSEADPQKTEYFSLKIEEIKSKKKS